MAGFFSLKPATNQDLNYTNTNTNPTSISNPTDSSGRWVLHTLSRNTAGKGFELWQQPPHDGGGGGYSLLGAGSMGDGRVIDFSGESTWGSTGYVTVGYGGGGGGGGSGGGGGVSCQDCGNQAKKDCVHMRCRTCCKSRGFECQTHVRSTWVPAARRRERRQCSGEEEDDGRRSVQQESKRTRSGQDLENPNLVNITSSDANAYNKYSGLESSGNFPSEVTTPANFRCVRVSSVDDSDDQFAYQAAVNINGHLFKGILYDQGPYTSNISPASSTPAASFSGQSLYTSIGGNDYMTSTQFFHQISRE